VLYIKPGPVPPPSDAIEDDFVYLSDRLDGDILLPVWDTDLESPLTRKNFTYHLIKSWHYPRPVRIVLDIFFYIIKGLSLYYAQGKKYQVIVTYGTYKSGIGAIILKYLTGAKLIVDVPGNPSKYFISSKENPSLGARIKHKVGTFLFKFICIRSEMIKLLYPSQLDKFPSLKTKPLRVFFAMTPLEHVKPSEIDEKFIFFLGSPWYLKGVDVLIKAFHLIKDEFPEMRLMLVGYTENPHEFKTLAKEDPRIEMLLPGVPHHEALDIFSRCSLFVLPSRTEAMGKVLLEAMASQKPVIGSNVDGIPSIINDGQNGLLFEPGNVEDLAEKIRMILRDKPLALRLAKNGRIFVENETTNEKFTELFYEMIQSSIVL
jgi:glycosyltransferase involved in cell wall biosynthesis